MARYRTANEIINRAAIEVGLPTDSDPVSSTLDTYVQLTGLLNSAGDELVEMNAWPVLVSTYAITTQTGDDGTYDLPSDFAYMTNQTGWNTTSMYPMVGPLSAQQWSAIVGQDLLSNPIWASFRLYDDSFRLLPDPPAAGIDISFEYISNAWLLDASNNRLSTISAGSDVVLFSPIMVIKMLKMKWLQAKGFPSDAAALEFDTLYQARIGKETGAAILNAGTRLGFPYLTALGNTPFTGFGGA
jgi:hypothetical protein